MNSVTLFEEAPVIKAQRDHQGNNNLYTSERLNKRVVLICCPCNGGGFGVFFLFGGGGGSSLLLEETAGASEDFPVSGENMQM